MLDDMLGIAIAVVAMAWMSDILQKLSSPLLAWIYALVMYGVYLVLAVLLCGYNEPGPILAPLSLFLVMAIAQMTRIGKPAMPATRRRQRLDEMTRELRAAFGQAEAGGAAPDRHLSRSNFSK